MELERRSELRIQLLKAKANLKYIEEELATINQSIEEKEWSKKEGKFFNLSGNSPYKEYYYIHKVSTKGVAICDIYLNNRLDRTKVELHANKLKIQCTEEELLALMYSIDKEYELQSKWINDQFN